MKGALGGDSCDTFLYYLEDDFFCWKQRLSNGMIAVRGKVKVKKVSVIETYADALEKALQALGTQCELVKKLEKENNTLRRDRETAMQKVEEIVSLKEEWEKKLYGRFCAVLNAKKEWNRELQEQLDQCIENGVTENFTENRGEHSSKSSEDEDEYGEDTDVDSDGHDDHREDEPATPLPSSSLRRGRDIFESWDSSPGSPVPFLPKRARGGPDQQQHAAPASAAGSKPAEGSPGKPNDVDTQPVLTQDLLDDF